MLIRQFFTLCSDAAFALCPSQEEDVWPLTSNVPTLMANLGSFLTGAFGAYGLAKLFLREVLHPLPRFPKALSSPVVQENFLRSIAFAHFQFKDWASPVSQERYIPFALFQFEFWLSCIFFASGIAQGARGRAFYALLNRSCSTLNATICPHQCIPMPSFFFHHWHRVFCFVIKCLFLWQSKYGV